MRVTLLGHASVLVEMDGATVLMDPVFFDPFEEGAVVSCPARTVYPERLPPIDVLIVSHRHPDHFDIDSLLRVPRDVDAICPADGLIVYALKQLGFARVTPVHTMAPILSSTFELFPTRSEVEGVREFGMVFRDSSGVFWNQVDSFLSDQTVAAVRERFGRIDLLFAMYASQNFDFFDSLTASFPYEAHQQNLANAVKIEPRLLAPGAAGFRFCEHHSWLNQFLFPISRERFVADLAALDSGIQAEVMNPGDVFEIAPREVRHRRAASPAAVMDAEDTALIRFDPTAPVSELIDPNPDRCPLEDLDQATELFVTEGIAGYARAGYSTPDRVLSQYREHHANYSIEVIFSDCSSRRYRLEFGDTDVRLVRDAAAAGEGGGVHRIAASALVDWIRHRHSFFYVRGYSRRYTTLYRVSRERGQVRLQPAPLPDLLMHYLLNVAPGSEFFAKDQVDLQIRAAHLARPIQS